ncbi:hypothetical protein BAUCODRAFT_314499 [Baudoinia panamericana UAMH 10762]|uniref:Uncharacterized protein n=1 Tax=Baudoinia panamericana (strain UAMH 10762) TaxID=717646 RepID=M2MXW4_BAUPA|nr:uncharacterized protein BAUCODRAFT_314499 [Baudoinia panamericana UAMH 10762]EMC91105.1 hypothetical protein BAUCODRAFT_314499 [Baudoinia panamericana UAMH 10762]
MQVRTMTMFQACRAAVPPPHGAVRPNSRKKFEAAVHQRKHLLVHLFTSCRPHHSTSMKIR